MHPYYRVTLEQREHQVFQESQGGLDHQEKTYEISKLQCTQITHTHTIIMQGLAGEPGDPGPPGLTGQKGFPGINVCYILRIIICVSKN